VIALHGLPGVGKTAIAARLVYDQEVRHAFYDGVLWAELGPRPDLLSILRRWCVLLGIEGQGQVTAESQVALGQALRFAIGNRRMLLVLDDAWSIEAVRTLQVGGAQCAYLLTTRLPCVALDEPGEALHVQELSEEDSARLLLRLAPYTAHIESEAVQTLVRSTGGLPLALTLMGSDLRLQFPGDVSPRAAMRMQQPGGAKANPRHDAIQRPVASAMLPPGLLEDISLGVQSVIAVSEEQLDEASRKALRALSVFPPKPNTFSEEAAQVVNEQPVETLDVLSDAGLLESSGPGRYTLHLTIADYARSQGQELAARQRLVHFVVRYIGEHEHDHEAIEREIGNLLAGIEVASTLGMSRELMQATHMLAPLKHASPYSPSDIASTISPSYIS
jgi:hypothetical protein